MPSSSAKPKKKPIKKTAAKAKPKSKSKSKAKPKTASKAKSTAKAKPKAATKKPAVKKKAAKAKKKTNWQSRAILRSIEAGASADCPFCDEQVSFKARDRKQQVICNIYENNLWVRVEQYHAECYKKAKNPYGKPKPK